MVYQSRSVSVGLMVSNVALQLPLTIMENIFSSHLAKIMIVFVFASRMVATFHD